MHMFLFSLLVLFQMNLCAKVFNHETLDEFYKLTDADIQCVKSLNVFFCHQSTGRIIMQSLNFLANKNEKYRLRFSPDPGNWQLGTGVTRQSYLDSAPIFGHFNLSDEKPYQFFNEIKKFKDLVDIAMIKYCFIDIGPSTTAQGRFNTYVTAMDSFVGLRTSAALLHWTMPLTKDEDSLSTERSKFRDLIIKKYGTDQFVFDIAEMESWYNNNLTTFKFKNIDYLRMNENNTYDNGHPNDSMAMKLAKTLWVALSEISKLQKVQTEKKTDNKLTVNNNNKICIMVDFCNSSNYILIHGGSQISLLGRLLPPFPGGKMKIPGVIQNADKNQ